MTRESDTARQSARERILQTAAALFFREGYHAVGVDRIIDHAGVAKMTLYRHFRSKDDLIEAYLRDANDKFWSWFDGAIARANNEPAQQILAVFEALEELIATPQCYGCPFLNAVVDFPDEAHPGHRVALEHKQSVRARSANWPDTRARERPTRWPIN